MVLFIVHIAVFRYMAVSMRVLFIVHKERLCLIYVFGGASLCRVILMAFVR